MPVPSSHSIVPRSELIYRLQQAIEFSEVLLRHIGRELVAANEAVLASRSNLQLTNSHLDRVYDVHHLVELIHSLISAVAQQLLILERARVAPT